MRQSQKGTKSNLIRARKQLEAALDLFQNADKAKKDLFSLTMIKAFEVLVEYAWKEVKQRVEDEGFEVLSPKDAVRQAASVEIIDKPDKWIEAINARNLSVHDYFNLSADQYAEMAAEFLKIVKKVSS